MSIASVKAYARARMDALGYTEWTDGYNVENIPKTLLDTAYHVELGEITGVRNNQEHQEMDAPFTVRVFFSPVLEPRSRIDEAVAVFDLMLPAFLNPSVRLVGQHLKTIRLDRMVVDPLDDSNDNGCILKVDFTAAVIAATS